MQSSKLEARTSECLDFIAWAINLLSDLLEANLFPLDNSNTQQDSLIWTQYVPLIFGSL